MKFIAGTFGISGLKDDKAGFATEAIAAFF
jgi:hypothetical protein